MPSNNYDQNKASYSSSVYVSVVVANVHKPTITNFTGIT